MPLAPQISQDLDGQIPWLPVAVDLIAQEFLAAEAVVAPIQNTTPWLPVLVDPAAEVLFDVSEAVVAPVQNTVPWLPGLAEPRAEVLFDVSEAVVWPIPHTSGRTQNLRPKRVVDSPLRVRDRLIPEKIVCVDKDQQEVACDPKPVAEVEEELFDEELDAATKSTS